MCSALRVSRGCVQSLLSHGASEQSNAQGRELIQLCSSVTDQHSEEGYNVFEDLDTSNQPYFYSTVSFPR